MKMKKTREKGFENFNLKILLLSFLFLFSFGVVAAANTPTLDFPAQDASISGSSYNLSVSLDTNTKQYKNATFFYDDGSSNTTIGTNVSDGESATEFNYTWDTTALVDVDDYVIWANITNQTGDATLVRDASTGVDIDNGNPTSSFSSSSFSDNLHLVKDTNFTSAIDADSSIGISSCNLYFTNENSVVEKKQSVSATANACSTSTTAETLGLSVNEAYTVVMEATDGNGNSTNSSSRTLVVTPSAAGGGGGVSDVAKDKGITVPQSQIGLNIAEKAINNVSQIPVRIQTFVTNMFEKIRGLFN